MATEPQLRQPPRPGFLALGPIVSRVERYDDKDKFEEAVKEAKRRTSDSSIEPVRVGPNQIVYSAPVGRGANQTEIRILLNDPEPENGLHGRRKPRKSSYHKVDGDNAEALIREAKKQLAQHSGLSFLGGDGHIERDEPTNFLIPDTLRVTLLDKDGGNEVSMLVNPPFPRGGGGGGILLKILAGTLAALGLGVLLFGRRRAR